MLPFLRNESAGAGGAVCAVLYAEGVPLELAADFFFLSFCLDIGSLSFMNDELRLEYVPLRHYFLPDLDIPAPAAKEEAGGAGFALSFFGFFFSRLPLCSRLAMANSLLRCGRHFHLHRGVNAAGASPTLLKALFPQDEQLAGPGRANSGAVRHGRCSIAKRSQYSS